MIGTRNPPVVTIDGPAGAGKSTVARGLARVLGFTYLDTGALYRAVALTAQRRGIDWTDGKGLGAMIEGMRIAFVADQAGSSVLVDGVDVTSEIRTPAISDGASRVSAHTEVRQALLALQRQLAREGQVVAEGRDMGTVVFPNASVKFFLTASAEERARRRAKEWEAAGRPVDLSQVIDEMRIRDDRDSQRSVAPLRKAQDAIEVLTDGLSPDVIVAQMATWVRQRSG